EPAGSAPTPAVAESTPAAPASPPATSTPQSAGSKAADVGSTAPSSAEPTAASSTASSTGPLPSRPTGTSRDRTDGGATSTPRLGGVVPAARRADRDDEPDAEHESKYLIEAEDIYGDRQSYSPPVIGEHR
ncbi:MAG TPA: hypothetical protein VGD84_18455, partial [Pseudonocardiaceae bacterium]